MNLFSSVITGNYPVHVFIQITTKNNWKADVTYKVPKTLSKSQGMDIFPIRFKTLTNINENENKQF